MQKHTSALTSQNFGLRTNIAYRYVPDGARSVLDYGCGRFGGGTARKKCEARGISWSGYDPYWKTPEENAAVLKAAEENPPDCVVCSNVLNVIDDIRTVSETVCACLRLGKHGTVIFSVYEGDGSGRGRETKPGCWQRNEPKAVWKARIAEYAEKYGVSAEAHGNVFVCTGKERGTEQ